MLVSDVYKYSLVKVYNLWVERSDCHLISIGLRSKRIPRVASSQCKQCSEKHATPANHSITANSFSCFPFHWEGPERGNILRVICSLLACDSKRPWAIKERGRKGRMTQEGDQSAGRVRLETQIEFSSETQCSALGGNEVIIFCS